MKKQIAHSQRSTNVVRSILTSIIFAAGSVLGVAAVGDSPSLPTQNDILSGLSEFAAGVRVHEMRMESQDALHVPKASEIATRVEAFSPALPTRSSFMATWDSVGGAKGYLLDVSTSNSFNTYLDGYHDLDVGNVRGRVVTGLSQDITYYYRVRAYDAMGPGNYSGLTEVSTEPTTGLIVNATFDSSITGNPNAAAIEAMINRAISIYESRFSDPVTIHILFRYSTTYPDGTPIPSGWNGGLDYIYYTVPWNTFISALKADATTSNDILANPSLPGFALSANVLPTSTNGRAVGLNTPPALFPDGTVGNGGPYDGIATLDPRAPFQFSRPTSPSNFDAQRFTEKQIDEIMGFGSSISWSSDVMPQDLFSWSSAGIRNITSSSTRYFSIDGGVNDIVDFNQDPNLNFCDWLSSGCPQAHPYVQNASYCPGQSSDVTATSPEAINLDVIGYDFVAPPQLDFNKDGHPDYLLFNAATRATMIWYMNNNVHVSSHSGPTLPVGWSVVGAADFNGDGHPDYLLFNPTTHATVIWYMNNNGHVSGANGPTLLAGRNLVGLSDFNGDGHPDYVLVNPTTRATLIWYMNNNAYVSGANGPTLPVGWNLAGVGDFNGNGHSDYVLFNPTTHATLIWYMNNNVHISGASGPTLPVGWSLVAP